MVDINKYLENQMVLAAKQRDHSKSNLMSSISDKSKAAADYISKNQDKPSKYSLKSNKDDKHTLPCTSTAKATDSDDNEDSDFILTSDDDSEVTLPKFSTSRKQTQHIKKIIDDGDQTAYNNRVKIWKESVAAASTGTYVGGYYSADIQYILEGNNDIDQNHELQNGLQMPKYLWKQLYRYQRTGIKWLWELHQVESGGLLGDEMGLGKTVQVIGFLAGLMQSPNIGGLGASIVVAPATVIYQWVSHFHFWCPNLRVAVLHHSGSHTGNHFKLIKDIHEGVGILLITYAGVVKYAADLMTRKWDYIILDEGHKIRNPDTQVSKTIKKIRTPHKLILTGSPMQNSLQELWSLFDFMRPGLLGTYAAFMEHFAQPITQGGYANATELQEATALEIAKSLKDLITPYILRRTKASVQEHIRLPEKNEQVLFCALSQEQRDLYLGYLMSASVRSIIDKDLKFSAGGPFRARILVALSTLRKICNHPDLYLYEAQEGSEELDEEKFGLWKRSGKMTVVNSLLKIWQKQGHRALIFTQSRAMLCILEQHLQNQNYKYLKMDGTVSVSQRQAVIKTFNENSEYLVFLSTTRVGGLGINLTGADRVIIYDPDWNPATDNQAKERAWRIGQLRNVTVYRLLSAGTIEEKIYQRQIFKNFLSNKILIDPNQKNVLTTSTLQGLFTLEEPNKDGDTETVSLFKHTKINLHNNGKEKSNAPSTNSEKLEAMRKLAKQISKKITKDAQLTRILEKEDPREVYKKKRDILLHPPEMEEPKVNLLDDKVTTVPFENILSELDIIDMHAKKNYEENLIKDVLMPDTEESCNNQEQVKIELEVNQTIIPSEQIPVSIEKNIKRSKRKHDESELEPKIENVVAIKKVKKKTHKKDKQEKECKDDDYVLSKLFSKAKLQTALQHDIVVGLAEKEKRHRMKEEAIKNAKKALRAVKFSSK